MISVVLPSYNGEKYITQSIESIRRQTYKDWELIIVDDCSEDQTGQIADTYAKQDERIHVIHNSHNCKLPVSLNIGFEVAQGQYFTWTSDDNAYSPSAFSHMLSAIEQQNVDFVFADMEAIDSDDYMIFPMKMGPVEELVFRNTVGACFLYRSQLHLFLKGYDSKRFLVEDYDFWLKVYRSYSMYHMEECLYYYRIHAASLSSQRKQAIDKAVAALLNDNLNYVTDREQQKKIKERINRL